MFPNGVHNSPPQCNYLELSQDFLMTLPHSVLASSPVTKGDMVTVAVGPRGQVVFWREGWWGRGGGQGGGQDWAVQFIDIWW